MAGIQVIARAAAIMRALGDAPNGLSLGALAEKTKLPRSTVQRIVCALEHEHFIEACDGNYGVRLGPELARLIYQSQVDIISTTHPLLQDLSAKLGESIALCGLEENQVVVLDRIVAEQVLRVVFPVGAIRLPIHETAPGKAMLAHMSAEKIDTLLEQLEAHAAKQLREELVAIRSGAVALDDHGFSSEMTGMAVAVETLFGRYAVAAVVPNTRVQQMADQVQQELLSFKAILETKLGRH